MAPLGVKKGVQERKAPSEGGEIDSHRPSQEEKKKKKLASAQGRGEGRNRIEMGRPGTRKKKKKNCTGGTLYDPAFKTKVVEEHLEENSLLRRTGGKMLDLPVPDPVKN